MNAQQIIHSPSFEAQCRAFSDMNQDDLDSTILELLWLGVKKITLN